MAKFLKIDWPASLLLTGAGLAFGLPVEALFAAALIHAMLWGCEL